MTTAAMSSCPVDVRFDLDEVLSTVMDGYSLGQRMNEVNSLISQLPLLMDEPSDDNNICTICREDFATRERIGRELVCTHIYHHHCIVSWLALDASCPLCRCIIFPNESV